MTGVRIRGFSLLESMIALAILSILVAVAVAGFREYVVRAAIAEGFAFADASRTDVIESLAMGGLPSPASTTSTGPVGHHIAIDWHDGAPSTGLRGYLLASADLPLMGSKKAFALELREGGSWYCVEATPYAAAGEALASRFLPALCRGGGVMPAASPRATGCGPDEDAVSVSTAGGSSVAACAPKCPAGHSRLSGAATCQPDAAPSVPPAVAPPPAAATVATAPAAVAAPAAATPPTTKPAPAPACPDGEFMEMDHQTGLPTGNCRSWNYGGGWQTPAPDARCKLGGSKPAPPKDTVFKAMTCDPAGGDAGLCAALPPDPAGDPSWVKTCNPGEVPFTRIRNAGTGEQEQDRGCMSLDECKNFQDDSTVEACQKHTMGITTTHNYSCTYCCVGDACNGGDPAGGGCPIQPGSLLIFRD